MLKRKSYFIREHVGFLKLSDTYDILDPETQEPLGCAKEKPSKLVHVLRFFINKRLLPTQVLVYEGKVAEDESRLVFSIHRSFSLWRSKINICDPQGKVLGHFQSKAFSLGGAFRVFDSLGNEVALVKGNWKGWNFRFLDKHEKEIGCVTKKWAGIGKELFTSADNYILTLNEEPTEQQSILLLAAGLAIDTVYKER